MTACFRHAMPYGAALLDDRRTRFRLWAPDRDEVSIQIGDAEPTPMRALDDGWFEQVAEAPAGTPYRYVPEEGLAVPDPASRLQHNGDVHGASVVVDPEQYIWQHPHWPGRPWREAAICELHVGVLGGYRGVLHLLPQLQALGITAIELMPLAQFPGTRNWGYDGVLPFAPAATYGTPDELKALIDTAHGFGLVVLLDVVYNHFGPEGNYLGAYASAFFHDSSADNKPGTPWGASIDVDVPQVGDFFVHNALYWLEEFRFDGLRLDAVHSIGNSAWLASLAARVRSHVDDRRHVHLILENEHNQAHLLGAPRFDAQWNDDFHNALHVLLTGETAGYYCAYADDPIGHLARCLAEGFAWQGEPMRGTARGEPSAHLSPLCFVNFLQNHDQVGNRALGERLTTLVDARVLDAAYALLLLAPSIPLLFMGEEWASRTPFLFFVDHPSEALREAVLLGRRREFAEFADYGEAARIPDPNALSTFEHSRPDTQADSRRAEGMARHALIGRLLALRRSELVPYLEQARALGAIVLGPQALVARWRLGLGVLSIHCNLGGTAVDIDTAPTAAARWLHGDPLAVDALYGRTLPAACTLVCMEPLQGESET
jgi:maltooligosyltrehalose trehalohydrolase